MRKRIKIIAALVRLLRPKQWLKNALLLFPPFFGQKMADPFVAKNITASLLSFSLMASCCYIINDIQDRDADRNHATKKNRAIASGTITVLQGYLLAGLLYLVALLVGATVSERFEGFLVIYLYIVFLYSFFLKRYFFIDILMISTGFVIRVMAGGEAFQIPISSWLFLTTFLVALFLASGKRLSELNGLGVDAQRHRESLHYYTRQFLERLLWSAASVALITYILYTLERKGRIAYTIPLVVSGFIRYIYLARQGRGEPTEALLKDHLLMCISMAWFGLIGLLIYLQ